MMQAHLLHLPIRIIIASVIPKIQFLRASGEIGRRSLISCAAVVELVDRKPDGLQIVFGRASGEIGIHARLKILWALAREGSSPSSPTKNDFAGARR